MCFEILGFDIILDHVYKPYLLEINSAPSFHTESPIDEMVKTRLLEDAFGILYKVGSRARREYRKRKEDEMKKNMTKGSVPKTNKANREIKLQETQRLIKAKDEYMDKNSGRYKKL